MKNDKNHAPATRASFQITTILTALRAVFKRSVRLRIALTSAILFGIALIISIFLLSEQPLYIAVVGPLSGDHKAEGEEMARGAQLLLDSVNRDGGVNGKPVRLLRFDDQHDPKIARQQALEIVRQSKILAVLGHFSGPASKAGARIYKEHGVPVVDGAVEEHDDNDWGFRITYDSRGKAVFLAQYIKQIFQQQVVHLISVSDGDTPLFIDTFTDTFMQIGGIVLHRWQLEPALQASEEALNALLGEIAEQLEAEKTGLVLLNVDDQMLARVVAAIKRAGVTLPLLTDYQALRRANFSGYPEEQQTPGYFQEGLFVTSPFLFLNTNESRVQAFRETFTERYFQDPDVTAALSHDAALIVVQAMKIAGIQGNRQEVAHDRQQIQTALASIKSIDTAVTGLSGPIYFRPDGSAARPVAIGVMENRKLIAALTQLNLANPQRIASMLQETRASRVLLIDDMYLHRTNMVHTGIDIHEISQLNSDDFSYTLGFDLWFRYRGDINVEDLEFVNAVEPIRFSASPQAEAAEGVLAAEQISEGVTYRLYRVKGRFKADFLTSRPIFFREHLLGLSFRHRTLTRDNLAYVADTLFMQQTSEQSFWEKMKQSQVLSSASGWTIEGGEFFQDTFEKISLANPKNLKQQKFTEDYSRFNAGIWIRKDEFTLRGIVSSLQRFVPARFVNYGLLSSAVIVIFLTFFVKRIGWLARFGKMLWCVHAACVVLLLLTSERSLTQYLVRENGAVYYLKLLPVVFDILWWLVGAFLLTLAVDRFLWAPLRKRTERRIPRILKHFVTVTIYALTSFGILAFVFGQSVSSLVATSGVFAVLFAFSNKVDISNIFAGIGISLTQPFRIGDWVKIGDTEEGQVVDMTSRVTKIQTRDYSMLSIPNTMAASSVIENYNYPDDRFRLQFKLETVPIHAPDRVQKILLDAVWSTDGVLKEPPPHIFFQGQGDSSAIYTVVFYIDDYGQKFTLKQAVWKRVWIHLERAGIGLATPRREILSVQPQPEDVTHPLYVLRHVDLFEPLSDEAKTALSERMRKHHFTAGETIVQQGGAEKSLFIVIEGAVSLWAPGDDGTPLEINRLGAGELFGEMQLLTGKTRTFGAVAITETDLFEINKDDIAPLILKNPELAQRFSKRLSQRQEAIDLQKELQQAQQETDVPLSAQILEKIQEFFGLTPEQTQESG